MIPNKIIFQFLAITDANVDFRFVIPQAPDVHKKR
jgi:hypothetical protein